MATVVHMPEIITGIEEAAISQWLVAVGDEIEVGTPLAEIETEKAVVEFPSEVAGTVLELTAEVGAPVVVGHPIAVVGDPGEAAPTKPAPQVKSEPPSEIESREPEQQPAPTRSEQARLFASPIVRRMAREEGVEISELEGTGPGGRIVRRDLEAYLKQRGAQPAAGPAPEPARPTPTASTGEQIPLTGMRKAIARRLTESKSTIPHFYLKVDCRVEKLLALRGEVNAVSGRKISVNDFVLKAVAGALLEVPEANSTWGETHIQRHASVDIAVAVAIEGGLVTPVVRDVPSLSLSALGKRVSELAAAAREGRLNQTDLEGGSFTVS
ncbi:MAG TPA: dihydrolipoamide acetyltransferase family protein, partial [Actinomycetales bacterium]|nr:dihydrolipoamide acetyltransferase family protein [Actinomycetales bacterium]